MAPETQSPPWSLAITFDLHETGLAIMRQNLRREFPDADDTDIDRRLQNWLRRRPGAEHGDAPGPALDPATLFP
jgi:hypothetical protein